MMPTRAVNRATWIAFSVSLAGLAACAQTERNFTDTTGTGGAPSGGAGSGATGGASTSASTGGGAPKCQGVFPSNGDACEACLVKNCCDAVAACAADPQCMECVTRHDPAVCAQVGQAFFDFNSCWANSCASDISLCAPIPACDAPPTAPSGGACFGLTPDDTCNPVTNDGCTAAESCIANSAGYYCASANSLSDTCGTCDYTMAALCVGGSDCVWNTRCARYCCDDGDCGSGTCVRAVNQDGHHPELGLCFQQGAFYF